ncbi:hypothetical protein BpHYR1_007914, partial [Brachionus plicatilis]
FINDGKKTEKIVIRFKPKSESDTITPILIKFKDEVTRNEILSKAKKLRSEKNAFQRIYLNPDLTIAQQHNYKRLREECKNANTNEVDKRYIHVILEWIIILVEEDHMEELDGFRRISSIEIGNLTLIGVYLTSNDSTKESVIEHKIDLAELNEVTGEPQRQEKLYLIIGDFNSDPW